MNAIVSGKVEKPKGSLGVFKANNNYKFTSIYNELTIPDEIRKTHYLRVIDDDNNIVLIALNSLPFYTTETTTPSFYFYIKGDYGVEGYRIAISCYLFYGSNYQLKFTMADSEVNNHISSFQIGTLE